MPARSDERLDGLLRDVLGYLNLSSGRRDPKFFERLDALFRAVAAWSPDEVWPSIQKLLGDRIEALAGTSAAFAEIDQARAVAPLVFGDVWPAYREWHADLLAHQAPAATPPPFLVARLCEAVLTQGGPWGEKERIVAGALDELNDFLGYRPVAVLRTPQKIEPYPHEWVAPVPLFVRGAGVGLGPYEAIISGAIDILRGAPAELLHEASFDLDRLDELALDPRAYDFEHPVNKRPNHQFGEWDPHSVDQRGYYRRFVLREPLLAALARWVNAAPPAERAERQFDAAAVAAGTLLMASGTSGWGPEAHDSTVSLGKLVGRIAAYRDAFYARLLAGATGSRGERLRAEAIELRQPFGAVRGFLNAELARERAEQLARVHVALLFAQLGDRAGAEQYVAGVPTPAARLQADMECQIAAARRALSDRKPGRALAPLAEAERLLERGIACGAFADPWNILGFQGQFSLFPAVENSVRDPRVDQLCRLVQGLLSLGVDAWTTAAAAGDAPAAEALGERVMALARWWDQFATADVSGVGGFQAADIASSGAQVSSALADARKIEAGRELAFWRGRVADFNGPAAYSLALSALVAQRQWNAAMGLLMLWLLNRHDAPLEQGEASFEHWATRWLAEVLGPLKTAGQQIPADRWGLAAKFFDFLEANADEYWQAPRLASKRLADSLEFSEGLTAQADSEDEEDDLFNAAYESMSYRDSTRDGVEADMLEGGSGAPVEGELDYELQRLSPHLAFLVTLARLWRRSVMALSRSDTPTSEALRELLAGWRGHAQTLEAELFELLLDVQRHPLGEPLPTRESLVEHDRRRGVRETLLDRVQRAAWEVSLARLSLEYADDAGARSNERTELQGVRLLQALSAGKLDDVRAAWPQFLAALAQQPLLYVPPSKGGDPKKAFAARRWHAVLGALAERLPRAGLLVESCQLLDAVLQRERGGAPGPGAVSEFDRFFEATYRALLQTLLQTPAGSRAERKTRPARELVELVQRWNHSLLNRWLTHSRLVRLSALERVAASARWQDLVGFIRRHGGPLFTQTFLNYGHLRSIRHLGVDRWLEQVAETPDAEDDYPLLADLDRGTPRKQAVEVLSVVVEAIAENYAYYREYNGTTTQSDRGENLYMLLDFLRLIASYDRICWNMRPLIAAHEVLLADGDGEAAALWRQSLAERTAEAADSHLKRYSELSREYGLRLPSVYERLSERFVRPLAIDRLKGLIAPAIEEARDDLIGAALTTLREEIDELLEAPAGSGVEAPGWITALLDEVAEQSAAREPDVRWSAELPLGPRVELTWDQIVRQLEAWEDEEAG
ncbi:MAG: hypothetical protein U0836_00325 [Pirellulales bacterium]